MVMNHRQPFVNLDQLTQCPACDADLGVPYRPPVDGHWRPPSMWLEVAGNQPGAMEWRLTLFGNHAKSWHSTNFRQSAVRWLYRMCGDGHVFLDRLRMPGAQRDPEWTVEKQDVMAAIGGVAAGKSYLLLRTLSQRLAVGGLENIGRRTGIVSVQEHTVDWLENRPFTLLCEHYRRMEVNGLPLEPTTRRHMLPFEFLTNEVSTTIVARILKIHEELAGPAFVDPAAWGQRIRQPIVRRYEIGERRVLVGIADLAGEQFDHSTIEDDYRRRQLLNYGTLIWVIDPVVTPLFDDFLGKREDVVAASLRPEGVAVDTAEVRRHRNSVQDEIATALTGDRMAENNGPTQQLLICVTKADLIHLALTQGGALDKLGESGAVVRGVAAYLLATTRHATMDKTLTLDDRARALVEPIRLAWHDADLRIGLAEQYARAIVNRCSGRDNLFWDLVHGGDAARIDVPADKPSSDYPARTIPVPSLDNHVEQSLQPGGADVLCLRDLVMSALACGVCYGLGYGQTVEQLFAQSWRELRFYLCSPFTHAPAPKAASTDRIEPLDAASFPALSDRSAALSQLLLSLLRGVRP